MTKQSVVIANKLVIDDLAALIEQPNNIKEIKLKSLDYVDFSKMENFIKIMLDQFPNLKKITLIDASISMKYCIQSLYKYFSSNDKKLESLEIIASKIDSNAAEVLGDSIDFVKVLKLEDCFLEKGAAEKLSDSFKKNTLIGICFEKMGGENAKLVYEAMKANSAYLESDHVHPIGEETVSNTEH